MSSRISNLFHSLVLDGVFVEAPDGTIAFHAAEPLNDEEVARLLVSGFETFPRADVYKADIVQTACRRGGKLERRVGGRSRVASPSSDSRATCRCVGSDADVSASTRHPWRSAFHGPAQTATLLRTLSR